MKRIVIACDGTWSRLDAPYPTNVAKLAQAVLPAGAGRGGAGRLPSRRGRDAGAAPAGWRAAADRVLGGLVGGGLMATLEAAYRFLVLAYAPGDEVYLFGFSRGAFTARSLAGLIRNCGILERRACGGDPGGAGALPGARRRRPGRTAPAACAFRRGACGACDDRRRRRRPGGRRSGLPAGVPLRLAYLGVWDTVGALGAAGASGAGRGG